MGLKAKIIISGIMILFLAAVPWIPEKGWAVDSSSIGVNAIILSSSNCRFSPPKTGTIDFGILDPVSGPNVNVGTTLTVRCSGSAPIATFGISDDDGLNETGPNANRLQHSTVPTEFIPYSLTITPSSASVPRNTDQIITISGTLNATDYQNALTGTYTDVVTVTIAP